MNVAGCGAWAFGVEHAAGKWQVFQHCKTRKRAAFEGPDAVGREVSVGVDVGER